MINFKANLINNTNVKCLNRNGNYKNLPVSFVELDIDSDLDLETLLKVKETWGYEDDYAKLVYNSFEQYHNKTLTNKTKKFYALTSQCCGFNNLDETKILGITQIYRDASRYFEIEALQTNPKYRYGKENRKIKHVGKAIIESLKDVFKGDEIHLFTTKAGRPLYQKLGFETVKDTFMILKR